MWKKGQSGNPKGRQPEQLFKTALKLALECGNEGGGRLRTVAEKLADAAAKGEPWAIKEVADRMDGKAAQQLNVSKTSSFEEMSDDQLAELADAVRQEIFGSASDEAGAGADAETRH